MASLYKPSYSRPIPDGASMVTVKGRKCARFTIKGGRRVTAPLTKSGKKCLVPTEKWYIRYRDADGVQQSVPGFKDKEATKQLAAQLERDAELVQAGLISESRFQRGRTVKEHLTDFEACLRAKGRSENYVKTTIQRVTSVVDECNFNRVSDIRQSNLEIYLGSLRDEGLSASTRNHYLTAMKMFVNWMVRDRRLRDNPLLGLSKENTDVDRRRVRRPLKEEEFTKLLKVTSKAADYRGLSGEARAVLYIVACYTGYRRNEIGSVSKGSFDFSSEPPTLTVEAGYSKRKRRDTVPLRRDFADLIESWLAKHTDLDDNASIFPISGKRTAQMLRADLELAEIPYVDDQGRYADFHALRSTFITNLSRSGVSPKMAQTLARHSDINLTMNIYTQVDLVEQSAAMECLPAVSLPSEELEADEESENDVTLDSDPQADRDKNCSLVLPLVHELVETTDAVSLGKTTPDIEELV